MVELPEHLQKIIRNTSPEKWEKICMESKEKFRKPIEFKIEETSSDAIFGEKNEL